MLKRKDIGYIKLLTKKVFAILFFLIAFFSMTKNADAANFEYKDFDFEKFATSNLGYWTNQCEEKETEEETKECRELVLSRQEKFYTRLYKLLTQYEKKGIHIDDKIIIQTVFFELDPDMFSDTGERYKTIIGTSSSSYNVDDDEPGSYNIDGDDEDMEYFNNESDTIKLLLKAMVGYSYNCYGLYPLSYKNVTLDDGTTKSTAVCESGGTITSVDNTSSCADNVSSGYTTFWEHVANRSGLLSFFGIKTEQKNKCDEVSANYPLSTKLITSNKKVLAVEKYWEFLENSEYFERKTHLQYRFAKVLKLTGHDSMSELTSEERETYADEIKAVKVRIAGDIKGLLKNYGDDNDINNMDYNKASYNTYWWPIGSNDVTTEGGKTFATGNPPSVTITSNYGNRTDPESGKTRFHGGIDISGPGEYGSYNIIAIKDGIVTDVNNNCTSSNDVTDSCGGDYGNYVIIQHFDGTYTVYAHMHENTITVEVNQSVKQGEVIGKMGSSGKSTGLHLHFEFRTDANTRVDPLEYVDPSNPRPIGSSITFMSGNDNMQSVCLSLKSGNYSLNGIAGVMTNINAESSFNPNAIGDSGTSYGLCQWHNSRWDTLKSRYPNNWEQIDGQLSYLFDELTSGYSSLYNMIISGNETPQKIAYDFCYYFERPQDSAITCQARSNGANNIFNYVNNNCQ